MCKRLEVTQSFSHKYGKVTSSFLLPSIWSARTGISVPQHFSIDMKFIIGKKMGMTQVFRPDGTVVPVTRVAAGPCVVTQVKTKEKEGVDSVQIGFGTQKVFRLSKPERGHLKGVSSPENSQMTVRVLRDFRDESRTLKRGDVFTVKIFTPGEKVQVSGKSKGRGFQGVVKRHGFAGSPATHGHKDQLRMPGSIGAGGVQRVFKNMRMAGHMGDQRVTVKNLEVVEVDAERNELLIKGAVPGARNGLLYIVASEGVIEIEEPKVSDDVVVSAPVVSHEESTDTTDTTEVLSKEKEPEVEIASHTPVSEDVSTSAEAPSDEVEKKA